MAQKPASKNKSNEFDTLFNNLIKKGYKQNFVTVLKYIQTQESFTSNWKKYPKNSVIGFGTSSTSAVPAKLKWGSRDFSKNPLTKEEALDAMVLWFQGHGVTGFEKVWDVLPVNKLAALASTSYLGDNKIEQLKKVIQTNKLPDKPTFASSDPFAVKRTAEDKMVYTNPDKLVDKLKSNNYSLPKGTVANQVTEPPTTKSTPPKKLVQLDDWIKPITQEVFPEDAKIDTKRLERYKEYNKEIPEPTTFDASKNIENLNDLREYDFKHDVFKKGVNAASYEKLLKDAETLDFATMYKKYTKALTPTSRI
jgi:hypothetical protein